MIRERPATEPERALSDLACCLRLRGYMAGVTELPPTTLPHLRVSNHVTGRNAVVRVEGGIYVWDDGTPLAHTGELRKAADHIIAVMSP